MENNNVKEYKYIMPGQADKIKIIINKLLDFTKRTDHNIPDIEFRLEITAREMLANAIEYGCENCNDEVEIIFCIKPDKIVLTVKDPGKGFNWQEHNFEIVPVLDEWGRGLKMINKVSDKIEFNERGNQIRITFIAANSIDNYYDNQVAEIENEINEFQV